MTIFEKFECTRDAHAQHEQNQEANPFFFINVNEKMIEQLDAAASADKLFKLAREASSQIKEMAAVISKGKIEDEKVFLYLVAQCLEFQLAGLVFDASMGKWVSRQEGQCNG